MKTHPDIQIEQYKTADNLNKRAALHRLFNTNPQPWNEWICSQLPLKTGDRVLDIGCGTGLLWDENRSLLPDHLTMTLSDRSYGMAQASKAVLENQSGFSFSQVDAQNLPFEDNTFDLITANHVLFFIPDIPQALNEIRRVLRPGGWLTATTNGKDNKQDLYNLVAQVKEASINTLFGGDLRGPRRFALENGAEIIRKTFGNAETHLFLSDLKITEAQPLIDSIESLWKLNESERDTLRGLITAEIQQQGFFFIAKSQGILLAQKSNSGETY